MAPRGARLGVRALATTGTAPLVAERKTHSEKNLALVDFFQVKKHKTDDRESVLVVNNELHRPAL